MNQLTDIITQNIDSDSTFKELSTELDNAVSFKQIISAAFKYALFLAVMVVEETLNERAKPMEDKGACPKCGATPESKGFSPRQIISLIGNICWFRRIFRCPKGCKIGVIVPFDEKLRIKPNQKVSDEIKLITCLLAVFVPYQIASMLMKTLTGILVSPASIWNYVLIFGNKAMSKPELELKALSEGELPNMAQIDNKVKKLIMAIGGDGVMVPFRPDGGSPEGKAVWRVVKIGIFARLENKITKNGKKVKVIIRKRVVAVLGTIDEFATRMKLMAVKERFYEAETVVRLSDGGKGFRRLFREISADKAHGVLDFYHAVQNVWKGAEAWLDGRTGRAREWFDLARHKIREGKAVEIIKKLKESEENKLWSELSDDSRKVLKNLIIYLETHKEHMAYDKFKALGLPIGSGMVESTCKQLIQQRFKGVGMRWSEEGFCRLLHLRIAWVNEEFDVLFSSSPN